MDETSKNAIKNFENVLKNTTKHYPVTLYSNKKSKTTSVHNKKCTAQEIISKVNLQIKVIQKADTITWSKQNRNKLDKYKKSSFLNVNMLPKGDEVTNPKPSNRFETQYVSDTELIDIVDNVEAIANSNNGITQEFDSTFYQTDDKNENIVVENENIQSKLPLNKNTIEKHEAKKKCVSKGDDNNFSDKNKTVENLDAEHNSQIDNISTNTQIEMCNRFTDTLDNETQNANDINLLNKALYDKNINITGKHKNLMIDDAISPSPVFQVPKSKTPSPLIFDLGSFEKFENIAAPIIEENLDLPSAKQLINSQIIGKELLIQTNAKCEASILVKNTSPILKISTEKLKVTKTSQANMDINVCANKEDSLQNNKDDNNTFLKDEILFSSDEEDEYVHKELQDIPLTCALETSFYDQPNVLDKTMYVGFQTASNKSIQIATESFTKAKSFLDGLETEIASSTSLIELVDSFSSKNVKTDNNSHINAKEISKDIETRLVLENSDRVNDSFNVCTKRASATIPAAVISKSKSCIEEEIELLKRPDKRKFDGFMTASRKKIKLSDMALARCKRVFQDIDLEDAHENTESKTSEIDEKVVVDQAQIDDDILQEFSRDMSSINEENIAAKDFVGFKTANNKEIKISQSSLTKAQNIFDCIDVVGDFCDSLNKATVNDKDVKLSEAGLVISKNICFDNNQPKTNDRFDGFKTASNKNIKISHAKNIFDGIDMSDDFNENNQQPTTSKGFIGFKTASNKNIKISDCALAKTKNIFDGIDLIEDFGDDEVKQTNSKTFQGFKTASNTDIKISDEAVAKTKNMFDDINVTDDLDEKNSKPITNREFERYKTISNKGITISEQTSLKTEDIFRDMNQEDNLQFANENRMKPITKVTNERICDIKELDEEICQDLSTVFEQEILDIETETRSCNKLQTASDESVDLFKKIPLCYKGFVISNPMPLKKLESKSNIAPKEHIEIKENKTLSNESESFCNKNTSFKYETENIEPNRILKGDFAKSNMDCEVLEITDNIDSEGEEIIPFRGFDIAPKKPTSILDDVDEKSNLLFRDGDQKGFNSYVGFKTGNNKPISVSSKALAKSKAMFQEVDSECSITNENPKNFNNRNAKTGFMGFQTGNNKPITVSSEALAKSKELFKDLDTEVSLTQKARENKGSKNNHLIFESFKSGNNKVIKVSSEALAKSKEIFKNMGCEDDLNTMKYDVGSERNTANETSFKGFQTASNKRINVSAEALARSKLLFKDIDDENVEKVTDGGENCTFKGFQTANNKPVAISNEALAKSKALLKDVDQDTFQTNTSNNDSVQFGGFKTANQKPITISAEALAKSKALFSDINNDENVLNKNDNELKGIANYESVLESERVVSKRDVSKIDSSQFKGFQTASYKKVAISEQALRKTREIFHDIDLSDCKENIMKEDDLKTTKATTDFKPKNMLSHLKETNHFNEKDISEVQIKNGAMKGQDNNIEKLLDTQIVNDFEDTLYTEDFCKNTTPKQSKRSGSPILSCPKPKRRKKFETPYRNDGSSPCINNLKSILAKQDVITIFDSDYKKNKRFKLTDLAKVEATSKKSNVDQYILCFDLETILDIEFVGTRNDLTDGKMTIEDLKDYFRRAVNKKLIPMGWEENHLKLIIWKLISYEIKLPHTLSGVCTAKNVLEQLKYRFDRELYNAERPALRKILEKDDVPSKTLVLCVAGILVDGASAKSVTNISSNVELLLTDGWYCIKASIDKMLVKLVYDEKITIGCKIVTNGAELINCEQGVSPWEDTSSVRLKISGNSTRRARWDARLGYHGNAAMLTRLSSVKPEGGKVSKLRVFVARVYPMLYIEKFEDGSTVTRSERLEHIHQVKYESEKQSALEKLYEEVEKELMDQESQDSTLSQVATKHQKCSADFGITESQAKSLEDRSNRKRERLLQNVQERVRKKIEDRGLNVGRNVVPLLKIRVAGVDSDANVTVTKGFMSIWKPNVLLTEMIKEGTWIEVLNVVPTAIRYSEIHLSAGRQSAFNKSKYQENECMKPHTESLRRKCYHIKDLAQNPTISTDYNEVDTVGLIFHIDVESNQPFQNIYLTDSEKNIICINFWGGLSKFGFQSILEVGQVIYGANLQKRAGNTRKNIPHFRVTEFTFFTKTPKNDAARILMSDLQTKLFTLDKKKYLEECVTLKNNFSRITENSPYRFNNDHSIGKNKAFIDSPITKCDDNLNLTGLDFESTFKQTDTQELSPKALQRRKMVQQKIAKLKMIGEPPPLSPLNIINKTNTAYNSFRSPLAHTSVASNKQNYQNRSMNQDIQSSPVIQDVNKSNQINVAGLVKANENSINKGILSNSPLIVSKVDNVSKSYDIQPSPLVQVNVTSFKKSYQNSRIANDCIESSPVLSMNQTYVKNMNPVKLNFNAPDTSVEEVDQFAEDFDGSPPLSLD